MTRQPPISTLFPSRRSSDLSPVYPCHVSPRDMRSHPVGTGPFKFVEFKPKDRKSTRLNSSHVSISYAVFCLKKKKRQDRSDRRRSLGVDAVSAAVLPARADP